MKKTASHWGGLIALLCCTSCSATGAADTSDKSLCGEFQYKNNITLTEQRVIEAYQPTIPTSPYPTGITKGCVGMSFSIDSDGVAFDFRIIKASHPRIFDKAAKEVIKKYRFRKDMNIFKEAYLIINFDIKE